MIPRPALAGSQPTEALARAMLARHPWRSAGAVYASYLVAILVGDALRDPASGASLFWLPNSVLVAAMVVVRPRSWPLVIAAGIAAELSGDAIVGIGLAGALGLGAMNALEAVLVAAAINWADHDPWPLRGVRSVLVAATAAVSLTAATAVGGAVVAAWVFGGSWITEYPTWWLGDSLGILVGFPVAVAALGQVVARSREGMLRWGVSLGLGAAGLLVGLAVAHVANPSSAVFVVIAVANAMALLAACEGAALGAMAVALVTVITIQVIPGSGPVAAQLFVAPVIVALLLIGAQVATMARQQAELEAANSQIAAVAVTDELTGLLNLRGLRQCGVAELARAVRSGTGLGVLYADVNGLKKINDELGHAVGSAALVELAAILRGTFRASDIIGRVGGDEFVVLFAAPDDRALAGARARLDDALAASSAQRPNRLSVSVGMLRVDPDRICGRDLPALLEELISGADMLMYDAKTPPGRER